MRIIVKITSIPALIMAGIFNGHPGAGTTNAEPDQVTLQGVKPLANERYVMVTFLSGIEFWVPARKGMEQAAKQLGVQANYQGTGKRRRHR